jgi:1,2-phenylacetyl-CoA epoxidase PaaB subunit
VKVWDVLQRSRAGDTWDVVGGVKAPDLEIAILLARESLFRRAEGDTFAVRRRGTEDVIECPDPSGIGGIIGREFRRMDSFAGVGGKHRRIHEEMEKRGLVIDRPRPPDLRQRRREDGDGGVAPDREEASRA